MTRPDLRLVAAPPANPTATPVPVRRFELNTAAAAVATGHLLAGALIKRGKALLVLPDNVLAGPALKPDRGPLPGDLLADLLVYSCPAGDPEANAPRYRLAPGTFARVFAVLAALAAPRHLDLRAIVVLATEERARFWWRAGAALMLAPSFENFYVETQVGAVARRLESTRPAEGEKLPALVLVDGADLPAPLWPIAAEVFGSCPADAWLLGLPKRSHLDAQDLPALFGGVEAVIGHTPETNAVWLALAGGGGYVLRSDAADGAGTINAALKLFVDPAAAEKPGQDDGDD